MEQVEIFSCPSCLRKEANRIANDAKRKQAKDNKQRIDALLEQPHAGKRHQKWHYARHQAVKQALDSRHDLIALAIRIRRQYHRHVDRRPFRYECAHDEQTEYRRTFREVTHAVAADLVDKLRALVIAVHDAVPVGQQTDDIERNEEDQRADDAARQRDTCTESGKNRTQRAPENRVADTGQWADKTNLDAGEGVLTDFRAIGFSSPP